MDKKHITILIVCTISMTLILVGLYATSPLTKKIYRGGFDRNFISESLLKDAKVLELPYNSYYIAGTSNNTVYLGNITNPFHMILINMTSLDSQHVTLKIKGKTEFKDVETFKLRVDSPYFYLVHGTMPGIFRGKINEWTSDRFMKDAAYFADAEPINKSSLALRSYSPKNESFELAKETNDKSGFRYNYEILEKQSDGMFCTSGMLVYNKSTQEIIYVYTFRNQYMVMDSSLNLKYRANTLDTFRYARVEVADVKSQGTKMLTGLPRTINIKIATTENYLFIRSNVLAKNEDIKSFVEGSTIDIYNTKNGKYVSSVNLYNQGNHQLSDFSLTSKKMITMYDKHLFITNIDIGALNKSQ